MNKHGYKLKYKNMKTHLIDLYKKREEIIRVLEPLSRKIEQLEKAKKNCKDKINSL